LIDEIYQCIECQKTFTKNQIEKRLAEFRQKRKREA
jgi:DNA-directed RNA polymerase subunit RPC12/RpoP